MLNYVAGNVSLALLEIRWTRPGCPPLGSALGSALAVKAQVEIIVNLEGLQSRSDLKPLQSSALIHHRRLNVHHPTLLEQIFPPRFHLEKLRVRGPGLERGQQLPLAQQQVRDLERARVWVGSHGGRSLVTAQRTLILPGC